MVTERVLWGVHPLYGCQPIKIVGGSAAKCEAERASRARDSRWTLDIRGVGEPTSLVGADEITLRRASGGEWIIAITGGWAKGQSLDTVQIGDGTDAQRDAFRRCWHLGDGLRVNDDGMEGEDGYPIGTMSFVRAAKALGIRLVVKAG